MNDTLKNFMESMDLSGYDDDIRGKLFFDVANYYEVIESIRWYKKAADLGNKLALHKLVNYYKTKVSENDIDRAKYLELAYEQGDVKTSEKAADLLNEADLEVPEPKKFIKSKKNAKSKKDEKAQIYKEKEKQAKKLYLGSGVVSNKTEAIALYKEVADSAYKTKTACKFLAEYYFNLLGEYDSKIKEAKAQKLADTVKEFEDKYVNSLKEAYKYYQLTYSIEVNKTVMARIVECYYIAVARFGYSVKNDNTIWLLDIDSDKLKVNLKIADGFKINKAKTILDQIDVIEDYFDKKKKAEDIYQQYQSVLEWVNNHEAFIHLKVHHKNYKKDGVIVGFANNNIIIEFDNGVKQEFVYPKIIDVSKLVEFKDAKIQERFMSCNDLSSKYSLNKMKLKIAEKKYNEIHVQSVDM